MGRVSARPGPRASRDDGAVLLVVVALAVVAMLVGLIATAVVERSMRGVRRPQQQLIVDALAESGSEEAVARIQTSVGLTALTSSPAYGTNVDREQGPWVRFGTDGQLVTCATNDARQACFTMRVAARPDLATGNEARIEISARKCSATNAVGSWCARSRVVTTMRARAFARGLLDVTSVADATRAVGGELLDGPILLGSDPLLTCGSAVVGRSVADPGSGGHEFRISATGSGVVATDTNCDTGVAAALVSATGVTGADPSTLAPTSQTMFETVAGITVTAGAGSPVSVVIEDGTVAIDGAAATALPPRGVLLVKGDATLSQVASHPLQGALTIVVTGTATITTDLTVADASKDLLGVVSTGGNIVIAFDGTARTIRAALVALAPSPKGIVSASDPSICPAGGCTPAVLLFDGAILARRLGAFAASDTAGAVTNGFTRTWTFDGRLAHQQPPYAFTAGRATWLRLDSVHVAPLGAGIG